ncbi:MAG: Retroviral aspartyl protease, partial [Cyanobacteriota bacterium]
YDATCYKYMPGSKEVLLPIMAKLLVDSGATTRFVSKDWCNKHGIYIKRSHVNWMVTVANKQKTQVLGSADVEIKLPLKCVKLITTYYRIQDKTYLHQD